MLRRTGRGHDVGTYLLTQGTTDRRLPWRLEGDERFSVDGRLAIHGYQRAARRFERETLPTRLKGKPAG